MQTLNRQRFQILIQHYWNTGDILSPPAVAKRECILWWKVFWREYNQPASIQLGSSIQQLLSLPPSSSSSSSFFNKESMARDDYNNQSQLLLRSLLKQYSQEKYLLAVSHSTKPTISISLLNDSSSLDVIKAYFHAEVLRIQSTTISKNDKNSNSSRGNINNEMAGRMYSEYVAARDKSSFNIKISFDKFVVLLHQKGWMTDHNLLGAREWRCSFKNYK